MRLSTKMCLAFSALGFVPVVALAQPAAGLRLHLRADQIPGATNGSLVSTWPDLSGNGNNATAAGTDRPTFQTNVVNGSPAVHFDGTDQLAIPAIDLTGTTGVDLFIVYRTSTTASNTLFENSTNYNTSTTAFGIGDNDLTCPNCLGGVTVNLRGNVGYNQISAAQRITSFKLVEGLFNKALTSGEAQLRIGGVPIARASATFDANNTNAFGNNPSFIGNRAGLTSGGLIGDIVQILLYDRILSAAERQQIEQEVASRLGADVSLAVELSSFTGRSAAGRVELSWATSSETDNAGFAVLRDGIEIAGFRSTSSLVGQGTTAQTHRYGFTDGAVVPGRTYSYRLRSTDRSGEIHDYPAAVSVSVVEATANPTLPVEFTLHPASPNPFNPTTTIRFDLPEAATVSVQVFNSLGQLVTSPALNRSFSAGAASAVTLDGAGLSSGVYLVRMTAVGSSGHVYQQAQRVLLAK